MIDNLGSQYQQPPRHSLMGITDTQQNMLRLIALGKTNKEIAIESDLALSTVKNSLTLLFQKLDYVDDRVQAILVGQVNGIININVLAEEFMAEHRSRRARARLSA
jgi:DNA-binding NarL/FixJ family response regulator